MKNFYPSKPVLPFFSAKVEMGLIISAIKLSVSPLEVKRSVYIIIRNESGNGHSVVNGTNPGGVQSDSGHWPSKWDPYIIGTCIQNENRTGHERGFVIFDTLTSGIQFMCERIQARGLYIGGTTHKITNTTIHSSAELAAEYYREWEEGSATYNLTDDELKDFVLMYRQAEKIFL